MSGKLVSVVLAEDNQVHWNAAIQHERRTALTELLEENVFTLKARPQPESYHLELGVVDNRLAFQVEGMDGEVLCELTLPISSLRNTIKEYFAICEAYFDAVKQQQPSRIETIDMARRGLHNDAATQLAERLSENIEIDHATARRLFTLICVLHLRELT